MGSSDVKSYMFKLFSLAQGKKVSGIELYHGEEWKLVKDDVNNKILNSIFDKVDDGDGIVQPEECNKLNKILVYIDSLCKKTKNNGIIDEKELEVFQKKLDSGEINIDEIPDLDTPEVNWSEGLDRKIKTLKLSEDESSFNLPSIIKELQAIGEEQGFTIERLDSQGDVWIEDSAIRRADGLMYVQHYTNLSIDDYKDIDGRSFNGGQGRVAERCAANDLKIENKSKYIGSSYLEGGNVLNTCLSDGTPAAIIGEDSIAYTLSAMELENTPENIEIVKKTIAKDLGLMPENVTFIPQYDFHIDMLYHPLHNGEIAVPDYDEAISIINKMPDDVMKTERADIQDKFLEMVRALRNNDGEIGEYQGFTDENLAAVEQEEYGATLMLSLVSKLVYAYHSNPEKFEGYMDEETQDAFTKYVCFGENPNIKETMIKHLEELKAESEEKREFAEKILAEAGYKVVKIPAFYGTNNFMNGVGGTSEKTGQTFYITNKPSIPELEPIIAEYFENAGVDKVYFTPSTLLLRMQGGLDCITQEE